jgi:hypothetical protein
MAGLPPPAQQRHANMHTLEALANAMRLRIRAPVVLIEFPLIRSWRRAAARWTQQWRASWLWRKTPASMQVLGSCGRTAAHACCARGLLDQ